MDDDRDIRLNLTALLRSNGYTNVIACDSTKAMLDQIAESGASLVLLDLIMPPPSGLEILPVLTEQLGGVPVIVITGRDDAWTAVECMKSGAYDYLVKAIDETRLLTTIGHALEAEILHKENRELKRRLVDRRLRNPGAFDHIIFADEKTKSILLYVESVALSAQTILITGETGTGKDVVASAIHKASGRPGELVTVNVSGVDETMLADTLFGHREGAYTGATRKREGLAAKAENGTLFLDEIGDLTFTSQVKLLRLVENGEYYPLGSDVPRRTNARIVVATNHDLRQAIEEGAFRRDLYYRLLTHSVQLSPLRERPMDIPALLHHFLDLARKEYNKNIESFDDRASSTLRRYQYPGNVRQLRAIVFESVSQCDSSLIGVEDLPHYVQEAEVPGQSEGDADLVTFSSRLPSLQEARQILIDEALRRCDGNQARAARLLGISAPALNKELRKRRETD